MTAKNTDKLHFGTSGWSYKDWVGPFYPEGTIQRDYLVHFATQFSCVEVDSTFYRIPSIKMVEGWASRTPEHFRFAPKVPSIVTHGAQGERPNLDKVLLDEDDSVATFLEALEPLGEKLGPVVFQFPYFRVKEFQLEEFISRLDPVLERLPEDRRFAVEVRNKGWLKPQLFDVLTRHRVATVMIDHPYMPWPREQLAAGMLTSDFTYIRLLGDRYKIEETTKTWEKIVVDRSRSLEDWAEVLRKIAENQGIGAAWVFANNHYAGHGPATTRELMHRVLDE